MPRRSLRLLAVLSVLVGIAAGAVVAVAVPRHAKTTNIPKLAVLRTAAPYPEVSWQHGMHATTRPRILLTAPDPAGGPDWALRAFSGTNILPKGVPLSHIGRELLGVKDCVELGRIHHGTFGWLDGGGTFRPVPAGHQAGSRNCRPHGKPLPEDHDSAVWTTWASHPEYGEPQPLATVVWGTAPVAVKAINISPRSVGTADLHRSADRRAFIAFLAPQGALPRATTAYAVDDQGHQHRVLRTMQFRPTLAQGRLAARAPDPDGGAPWGMAVVRGPQGTWCTGNAGRVVGDGVGQLDPRTDVFFDQSSFAYNCPALTGRFKMSHNHPLVYGFSAGVTVDDTGPGSARDHGRIALRHDPGATVFSGVALPGVVSITVIAPTQTRTIRPSGPSHAFVIAFPGSFPSGRIQLVSHFADGTTATQGDHTDDLS
ncbi:hypothetical protein [Conexibacter woesei]|uniref:hypothetical protein n=1 Tax=Conexibacter woesei TaxID=191495 RepID=UPI0003F5BF2B|nr:hypothetical protein [Conexibacter woesei]